MRTFDRGTVIRSRDGFWLAIPTPRAPRWGTNRKRINLSNFPEHRFGPLRFVYRRSGPSLLVVDSVRIGAKTGRIGRRAKGGAYTKRGRMLIGSFRRCSTSSREPPTHPVMARWSFLKL
ncbi:MAG: hypothetical protein HQL53_01240 [Magnetococcales bacterium]|nr:hypothetical protein [Magnetococcales bacterium]